MTTAIDPKQEQDAHKFDNLIGEVSQAEKDEAFDKIIKARVKMLMSHGFFGNLATRLKIADASEWCPTAATDGRYFFYNTEFIQSLDDDELIFLMGHEVLHNVYDHMDRRGNRDPRLWNIANDYVVNMDLVENNIGKRITKVNICFDYKYQNWISDEIYDDLYENAEKITEETLDEMKAMKHFTDGAREVKKIAGMQIAKDYKATLNMLASHLEKMGKAPNVLQASGIMGDINQTYSVASRSTDVKELLDKAFKKVGLMEETDLEEYSKLSFSSF